jgi:hypothetical protein
LSVDRAVNGQISLDFPGQPAYSRALPGNGQDPIPVTVLDDIPALAAKIGVTH